MLKRSLVRLRISNTENVRDKFVGIGFRRCDQLKPDVFCDVLGKIIYSKVKFGLSGNLEVPLNHVRLPAGNGGENTKGRYLDVLNTIKRGIVVRSVCL